MFRKFVLTALTLAAVGLGSAATSYAHVVTIAGAPNPSGRIFKQPTDPEEPVPVPGTNLLQITFNVTNFTPNTLITGVGFALPDSLAGFSLVSGPNNFSFVQGVTNGFGTGHTFDYAVLSLNSSTGVGTGQTVAFTVTGPSFGGLSVEQILDFAFVRFEAAGPGGVSGVGQAFIPQAVPEPATMILLGTGLAGIAAKVRKRRKGEPEETV